MHLRFLLLCCLVGLVGLVSNAQYPTNATANRANHWLFGRKCHIEFTKDSIKKHRIPYIFNDESSAAQSDAAGSLAYFIGGRYLYRGDGFMYQYPLHVDESATQGVIILRHPLSASTYFITSNNIGYTILNILHQDSFTTYRQAFPMYGGEKQQATKHRNGIDLWYANHAMEGDSVYYYLLKEKGLLECPVMSHTNNKYEHNAATQGQMKFSADGRLLGEVTFVDPFSVGLYHFDNEYPHTSPIYLYSKGFSLTDYEKRWMSGLEISPNKKYLYAMVGRYGEPVPPILYQIDVSSGQKSTIDSAWLALDTLEDPLEAGDLQIAPNGKIYLSQPGQSYLGVINNPDSFGTACNYVRQGLPLDSGGISLYGLPNFVSSDFYTPSIDFTYQEDCWEHSYSFNGLDTFGSTSWKWIFKDVRNGTTSLRQGKNINYTFPQADSLENEYEVTHIANSTTRSDTVTKNLTIRPKWPVDMLGRDTFYCVGDSIKLTLQTPADMHCIHWNDKEPYANLAKDTMVGYENFYGHITQNQSRVIDTAGVYTVRVTNKTFCQMWDTLTVREHPNPNKSEISKFKDSIVSNTVAHTYRWYRNGVVQYENESRKLKPDSNGYWQVQLVSQYGCESELSDSLLVKFASINDLKLKTLNFKIYPNPSDGHFTIEVSNGNRNKTVNIEIFDLNGKLVHTQESINSELITINSRLISGSYLIRIMDQNGNSGTQKLEVLQ